MKPFILLFSLIYLLCISCSSDNTSSNNSRFTFIDYNDVLKDLKSMGQKSKYYQKLDYEAMLYLDTNCLSVLETANPVFIEEQNINLRDIKPPYGYTTVFTMKSVKDLPNIKNLFEDKLTFDKICPSLLGVNINFNNLDSIIYVKDETAIFTCHYSNGCKIFRASLKKNNIIFEGLIETIE